MNRFHCLALAAVAGFFLAIAAPAVKAQSCDVAEAPECPYGYFDAAPYACAPYGYYGPDWFKNGVFTGAGPWFHGPNDFHGDVDNHFHPDHGYKGAMPKRGEKPDPAKPLDKMAHFKGNEVRDGRGNIVKGKDDAAH